MGIQNLFTVPDGEKVTEKALRRVLISSICSILLCMACLVSATWAWFSVSIENKGNVIQISSITKKVVITADTNTETSAVSAEEIAPEEDGSYRLPAGEYTVEIELSSDATGPDSLHQPQNPVYAVMETDDGESWCWEFTGEPCTAGCALKVEAEQTTVRFSVSWKPYGAVIAGADPIVIGEPQSRTASDQDTTPGTDPTTDPSGGGLPE